MKAITLLILSLTLVNAHQPLETHPVVDAYITLGLPSWAEIMIGFAVGTPIQGVKLFFPYTCFRNIFDAGLELTDSFLFYEQILYGDPTKNTMFLIQSMISIGLQVPQIMGNCFYPNVVSSVVHISEAISDSIMDLVKTFVYLDTSISMLFKGENILCGYYGMYAVLNMVEFIAFFSLNTSG